MITAFNQLQYEGTFDNLVKACPGNAIRYDSEAYDPYVVLDREDTYRIITDTPGVVKLFIEATNHKLVLITIQQQMTLLTMDTLMKES